MTLQFGQPVPGREVIDRPGAYGVALMDGRLLIVRWKGRMWLPGGGIHDGETEEEALRREFLEETGYSIDAADLIGRANEYAVGLGTGKHLNKQCAFFRVDLAPDPIEPIEADHEPLWVSVDEARDLVSEESVVWAIDQVVD